MKDLAKNVVEVMTSDMPVVAPWSKREFDGNIYVLVFDEGPVVRTTFDREVWVKQSNREARTLYVRFKREENEDFALEVDNEDGLYECSREPFFDGPAELGECCFRVRRTDEDRLPPRISIAVWRLS